MWPPHCPTAVWPLKPLCAHCRASLRASCSCVCSFPKDVCVCVCVRERNPVFQSLPQTCALRLRGHLWPRSHQYTSASSEPLSATFPHLWEKEAFLDKAEGPIQALCPAESGKRELWTGTGHGQFPVSSGGIRKGCNREEEEEKGRGGGPAVSSGVSLHPWLTLAPLGWPLPTPGILWDVGDTPSLQVNTSPLLRLLTVNPECQVSQELS